MYHVPDKPVELWGLRFPNRVGLAAGWDKDGITLHGLGVFGFGHVEIGTVTPRSQSGRKKPRVFRLVEEESIINRMGFPSRGEDYVVQQFMYKKLDTIVGVNMGKNADTPNEEAHIDYCSLLTRFAPFADYFVINLSSPNTAGLRDLQERNAMENLLKKVNETRQTLSSRQRTKPLLVKLSPDMSDVELETAVGVAMDAGIDGIIATNTTLSREGLTSSLRFEAGGASGRVLTGKSREVLRKIVHQVDGRVPVVSSGGIMTAEEGKVRVDMGASLVQLYTGFVYRGPRLVKELNEIL